MSQVPPILSKAFAFYRAHQDELVEKYQGRVVVIKDNIVLGAYGSELEAVRETSKFHPLGTFLVQRCEPGTESYTRRFYTPLVSFW